MKIVCLVENTAIDGFSCEHGLSLYIETNNKKILFDMGQTDLFIKNAEKLNVDLSKVDFAVLSHGHYDHCGGLADFLKINKTAKIYGSKFCFGDFYNGEKYIGLDKSLKNCDRIVLCNDYYEIDKEIKLFSLNNEILIDKIDSSGLCVGKNNLDVFLHEHYLKIVENNKVFVFSGCSHKGIINIANHFNANYLIGGFHIMKKSIYDFDFFNYISENLSKLNTKFYTCHCSGIDQYNVLKNIMKDKIDYLSTGKTIDIK